MKYLRITFLAPLLSVVALVLAGCTDGKSSESGTKTGKEAEQRAAAAAFAATTTATRKAAAFAAQTSAARKSAPKLKYNSDESPEYTKQCD